MAVKPRWRFLRSSLCNLKRSRRCAALMVGNLALAGLIFSTNTGLAQTTLDAEPAPAPASGYVALVALSTHASNEIIEQAAGYLSDPTTAQMSGEEFNFSAVCQVPMSAQLFKIIVRKVDGAPVQERFENSAMLGVIKKDGVTVLKVNAGNQIWMEGDKVYRMTIPEFDFLSGAFLTLSAEKECAKP